MSHIFRKFSRFIHSFCAFWIKVKISAQVRRRIPPSATSETSSRNPYSSADFWLSYY